jgi:hypothetical protein
MASRPYLDFYNTVLREYGVERMLDEVGEGVTIGRIQERVTELAEQRFPGKMAEFGHAPVFSRQMLYMWLDQQRPDNPRDASGVSVFRQRYQLARTASGHSLVDRAADKLEVATPDTIAVVREQVKHDVWRAARYNREEYGDKPMEVNISLGGQHLDALRLRVVAPEQPALPPPADYEIVEGDNAEST